MDDDLKLVTEDGNGVSKAKKFFINFLVVLIVGSFFALGIGEFLMKKPYVARIGNQNISPEEFRDYLKKRQSILVAKYGSEVMSRIVNDPAFKGMVLDDLVDQKLIQLELGSMKLNFDNEVSRAFIRKSGKFIFSGGDKFDEALFKRYLAQTGMRIELFLKKQSSQLREDAFMGFATGVSGVDLSLSRLILRAEKQKRELEIYVIGSGKKSKKSQYSEEEYREFYQNNSSLFTIPPEKVIHLSTISPKTVKVSKDVSRKEMLSYYQKHFILKSGRATYHYLRFATVEMAEKFLLLTSDSGVDFKDAYREIMGSEYESTLIKDVPFRDLADTLKYSIYKIGEGNFSDIVRDKRGYAVAYIDKISSDSDSFSKVKGKIKKRIIDNRLCTHVKHILSDAENLLDSGGEIVSLQDTLPNLKKIKFQDNEEGYAEVKKDFEGKLLFDIMNNSDFYGKVVNSSDIDCGYYLYKIEKITPEKIGEFDNVRGRVVELFLKNKSELFARERAEKLVESLSGEAKRESSSVSKLYDRKSSLSVSREQSTMKKLEWSEDFILDVFIAENGDVLQSRYNRNKNIFYVVRVLGIDNSVQEVSISDANLKLTELQDDSQFETRGAYLLGLRQKYNVNIREELLLSSK